MPLAEKYYRHPAPGGTGAGVAYDADQPLDAGRADLLLAHNTRRLTLLNARRPLAEGPSFRDFWAASVRGGSFTGSPTPGDIRWDLRMSSASRAANARLGSFWVHRDGFRRAWPRLVLRLRGRAPTSGTHTLGVLLVVCPGLGAPTAASAGFAGATTTSVAFVDLTLTVPLREEFLELGSVRPSPGDASTVPSEDLALHRFTAFFGAYNSSNNNAGAGANAYALGLALGLEPA